MISNIEPLCTRVCNIERDFELDQDGQSMSVRISMMKKKISMRISKLEDLVYRKGHSNATHNIFQVFTKKQVDDTKASFVDRLLQLENELGLHPAGSGLFQRIKIIEAYVDKTILRTAKIEECVHHAANEVKSVVSLHERLGSLEQLLNLESTNGSISMRISNVEKSCAKFVFNLEKEIFRQADFNIETTLLFDRLDNLREELGLEDFKLTQLSKIVYLEKGIRDMKARVDEFDQMILAENENSKDSLALPIEVLCMRVWNLEQGLGLELDLHSIPERILIIKKYIYARVIKVENIVYQERHSFGTQKNLSKAEKDNAIEVKNTLKERLLSLEMSLGTEPVSSVPLHKIKSIESYIESTKSRIASVEEGLSPNVHKPSGEVSLRERLGNLELSLGLQNEKYKSQGSSIDSRVSRVENSFVQRVADLEEEVYFHHDKQKESIIERLESLRNELGLEDYENTDLSKIAFLKKCIKDIHIRMDDFDGSIIAKQKCSKPSTARLSEPLCIRVLNLEKEMCIERDGNSVSEWLSKITNKCCISIRKIE
eukprot:1309974-Ditylum_brightwellii.AAC.1